MVKILWRGALAMFLVLVLIGLCVSEGEGPDAGSPAASGIGAQTLQVGGTYVTHSADFIAADSEEDARWALVITRGSGRTATSDTERLGRRGIRRIHGRHKVRALKASADGKLVLLEQTETGERLWTVPDAVAMPLFDADDKPILVGAGYVVDRPATVGAPTAEAAEAAFEAVVTALPERDLFATRPATDWREATSAVVARMPGTVVLPTGTRVRVVDWDIDQHSAVRVRSEGDPAFEGWTISRHLRRQ